MSNTRFVECSMVPSPKRSPMCWNNGFQTNACEYSHSNSLLIPKFTQLVQGTVMNIDCEHGAWW